MGSYAWKSILRGRDIIQSFENHTIDTLIDPSTRQWNEELVYGLFMEEDAKLIKKIPLSGQVAKDILYWPYSTSENYSCRSKYRFLKEEAELQSNPDRKSVV